MTFHAVAVDDLTRRGGRALRGRVRACVALPLCATLAWPWCHRATAPEPAPASDAVEVATAQPAKPERPAAPPSQEEAMFAQRREAMVRTQIAARGIRSPAVLDAMRTVPRHRFVPDDLAAEAYDDTPLPIGHGQTISQPYIVALMTELVHPDRTKRALDVGTGSGYQAAILAETVKHVDSIEIVCPLADRARARLDALGYDNVTTRCGDGWAGWPEHAPYDVIIVAAAPLTIPPPLLEQLAVGGYLVIPIGGVNQDLILVQRHADGRLERTEITPVRFVPMTGRAREPGSGAP